MLTIKLQKFTRFIEKRKYTPRTMAIFLRKCGVEVGEGCFISPTDIESEIEPNQLKIGNHVAIAEGVSFMTHDEAAWVAGRDGPAGRAHGPIVICDNCFIGLRSIIYPNVRIGPNSVVAAGSVVIADVPPNTLAMGVPARPFGSLDRYREKCVQRWSLQRPPDVVIDSGETWWNSRHLSGNRELLRTRLLAIFQDRLS